MKATSNLIVNADLAVLTLGDTQYETGTLSAFQQSYNPTWGELSLYLQVGNHEYSTSGASGYYSYFGACWQQVKRLLKL